MSRARLLGIAVVVVLLCAGLGLSAVLAQDISVNSAEEEPNDSIWEANGYDLGYLWHGKIGVAGDLDYYQYYVQEGMLVAVTIDMPAGSPLSPVLSIYNWDGQLLAQAACSGPGVCLTYQAEDENYLYLSVADANNNGGRSYQYSVVMDIYDVYEPNDFMEQAAPIQPGDSFWAVFAPEGDMDYYSFDGEAGDEVLFYWSHGNLRVLDADGNEVWTQWNSGDSFALPAAGTYYIELDSTYCGYCSYRFAIGYVDNPLYLSLNSSGVIDGVSFTSGDVLLYWMNSRRWEMYFDASDVGLKGNLVALDFYFTMPYLVYNKAQTVPELGVVGPNDIIAFEPETTGEDTAGTLRWIFDGSDVGLTTSGEAIDALGYDHNTGDVLLLSTSGTARVPYDATQWRVGKSDILQFDLRGQGANTSGFWEQFHDGFTVTVGAANLSGLDTSGYYNEQKLYLSFDKRVVLDGVVLDPGDIALCQVSWYATGCESVEKFFDASDAGLGSYKLDAFEVGTPPNAYP